MEKILNGLIAIMLLTTIADASGISELGVFIVPKGGPVMEDNVVRVSVIAKNVDNIGNLQLHLKYNPDVLVAREVMPGELVSNANFSNIANNFAGNITIEIEKTGGFSGEGGSIAKIKFISIGNMGMSSPLNITVLKVLDTANTQVTVSGIRLDNATYIVGRDLGASPGGAGGTAPELTEVMTTPIPMETTKETSGFGIIVSVIAILAISLIHLSKRRVLKGVAIWRKGKKSDDSDSFV